MAKLPTTEQFWQFSLQLYPTIQQPLLGWQEQLGANVNLMLLLLYAEQQHWHWSAADLALLQQAVTEPNQLYTQPIRLLRRQLSDQPTLKQALLQAELEAEKIEQQYLLAACPPPDLKQNASELLKSYLQSLQPADISMLESNLFDLYQSLPR